MYLLIFFIPKQYTQNVHSNIIYWLIIFIGFTLFPYAYIQIRKRIHEKITVFFLIYLLFITCSTTTSVDIGSSTLLLVLNAVFFGLFMTSGSILISNELKESFFKVIVFIVSVLAVISNYNFLYLKQVNLQTEGLSFMWIYFGHNHLAALLIIAIPILYYFIIMAVSKISKGLLIALLTFLILSLVMTLARGAIASLIIASLLGFFLFVKASLKKYQTRLLWIFLIGVLFVSSLVAISFFKRVNSFYPRIAHIEKSLNMFIDRPFFGYGQGTYKLIYTKGATNYTHFAHNLPAQVIAEQGILGLVSITIILFQILINSYSGIYNIEDRKKKTFNSIVWVILIGLLINEMIDFDLQIISVGSLFWILAGLVYPKCKKENINNF